MIFNNRHPSSSQIYRRRFRGDWNNPGRLLVVFGLALIIIAFTLHQYRLHQEKLAQEQAQKILNSNLVTITFPEGLEARLYANLLEQAGVISAEDWLEFLKQPKLWPAAWRGQYWFIDLARKNTQAGYIGLEGFLFPDTYEFFKNQSADKVTKIFLDNFMRRSSGLITGNNQVKAEKIILASIIEREVQTAEDMALVADLFKRRLNANWTLQSDATLRYVIPANDPTLNFEELKSDSKFNSYKFTGLPPTAISNPGLKALRAVSNPKPNQFWYFLTDKKNTVHYSRTYDEHLRNKNLYLR